jgi:hypothetical protein
LELRGLRNRSIKINELKHDNRHYSSFNLDRFLLQNRRRSKAQAQAKMITKMQEHKEEEQLTTSDLLYLKVSIGLAVGNDDILEMPRTKEALDVLFHKVDRLYRREASKAGYIMEKPTNENYRERF